MAPVALRMYLRDCYCNSAKALISCLEMADAISMLLTGCATPTGLTPRLEAAMAPRISSNLSRIGSAASKVNALADEATKLIRELEAHLAASNLGIEYSDTMPIDRGRETRSRAPRHDDDSTEVTVPAWYTLAYGRSDDGGFGLIVTAECQKLGSRGEPLTDEFGDPVCEVLWARSLDRVSRNLRILAMRRMSDFLEGLAADAEHVSEMMSQDIVQVRDAANELRAALDAKGNK